MPLAARRFSPSTARNRDPILEVLRRYLPAQGLVLELASGTGEHAVHFARHFSHDLIFQPSEPDAASRASIDSWTHAEGLSNVRPALDIDVLDKKWPVTSASAVLCINMIHIAPWQAAIGLVEGASRILRANDPLILYGPFRRHGAHTAPSNEAFDADLQARDARWGVRNLEDVAEIAAAHGFSAPVIEAMPANNLMVIFSRDA